MIYLTFFTRLSTWKGMLPVYNCIYPKRTEHQQFTLLSSKDSQEEFIEHLWINFGCSKPGAVCTIHYSQTIFSPIVRFPVSNCATAEPITKPSTPLFDIMICREQTQNLNDKINCLCASSSNPSLTKVFDGKKRRLLCWIYYCRVKGHKMHEGDVPE
jgi:hypothetical protein